MGWAVPNVHLGASPGDKAISGKENVEINDIAVRKIFSP
jgi:hypothetical protein